MGATDFIVFRTGPDAKTAFRLAVEDALYEYGHAGYSGTIAEKESFVMIPSKAESAIAAEREADELIRANDPRIDDKWGPAGCIHVVDTNGYVFFGWASS